MPQRIPDRQLRIITVHSPEFAHERDLGNLRENVVSRNLTFPVFIDTDLRYFRELNSQGWPTILLLDRRNRIRYVYLGETHGYFAQARSIERALRLLLAE